MPTTNQNPNILSGFSPTTQYAPNRIMQTNSFGYADVSDISPADMGQLFDAVAKGVIQTSDNTPSQLLAFQTLDDTAVSLQIRVVGKFSTNDACYFNIAALVRNNGGMASMIGLQQNIVTPFQSVGLSDTDVQVQVVVLSNVISVKVVGEIGKDIDWKGFMTIVSI